MIWPGLATAIDSAGQVDRVELKALLDCSGHPGSTLSALGVRPRRACFREVFFLDTSELALHQCGVLLRLRQLGAGRADLVIKLREHVVPTLPALPPRIPGTVVELDATPAAFLRSTSVKSPVDPALVPAVTAGYQKPDALFSDAQRAFLDRYAPRFGTDQLQVFGPMGSLRWSCSTLRAVVEAWWPPYGPPMLEVSGRCCPDRAEALAGKMSALLADCGVTRSQVQDTKTELSLRVFATGDGQRTLRPVYRSA